MDKNRGTICNGNVTTNQGFRKVAFGKGNPKPVLYAVRSGYVPERCTHQMLQLGDSIITCEKYSYNSPHYLTIEHVVGTAGELLVEERLSTTPYYDIEELKKTLTTLVMVHGFRLKREAIDKVVVFLMGVSQGRVESFLPDGIGWENDNTVGDIGKINKFHNFLKPLLKDAVIAEEEIKYLEDKYLKVTAAKTLQYDWDKARPISEYLEFIRDNPEAKLMEFIESNGVWKSIGMVSDDTPMSKALVIVLDAHCRNNSSDEYGLSVNLFRG